MSRPRYDHPEDVLAKCLCWYEPNVPTKTSDGILDPVDPDLPARVDLARFLDFPDTSPLGRAARLVASPDSMRSFQYESLAPMKFVPSSLVHKSFVPELLQSNLCTINRHALGFAKFFTVEKKLNEDGIPILRTILDCQRANDVFIEPDPVNLATVADMVDVLDGSECIRTLDLRHMYHQVLIHEHLRPFFTVALGSIRLRWSVLPMGWKWACFVAQAITTYAVAGDVARSWTTLPRVIRIDCCTFCVCYDNVIGGGPSAQLATIWETIVQRLTDPVGLNAVIKEEDIAYYGQYVETLGLRWYPTPDGLRWCLLEKLVNKALSCAEHIEQAESLPLKVLAGGLGVVAWARYASKGHLFDLASAYRCVADAVAVVGWNGRDLCSRYGALITALRHVGTIGLCSHGRTVSESLVFSDAHVSGYGFVGGQPRLVYSKEWPRRFESRDMFFLEAIAAKQAVSALASNEGRIFLALDNKAVVLAIAKRSTTCPRTASILAEMFCLLAERKCKVAPGWIPTAHNPADELSRGLPLDEEKVEAAHGMVEWTAPPALQWGYTLGRAVG
eukprot:PhM_4_TR3088/c0_g3_i2/m.53736